jgi:WD40 repeat protein
MTVAAAAAIQTTTSSTAMATSHFNKRHKTPCRNDAEKRLPIQEAVDAILNVDRDELMEHVRGLDWGAFKLLLSRLSELGQDMEDTLASFSDIPPNVIASNMFPYLEKRTDWNNFSLVNKDINKALTSHKQLEPPWPEGNLTDESIDSGSILTSPTFSPDGEFIANGDNDGNIYLWNRTKGLIANLQGYDRDDDDSASDEEGVSVDTVIFSPDSNLLASVGNSSNIKIWDLANGNRCLREWTEDNVSSVVFSSDGKFIATARGEDQPVDLRNVSDGTNSRSIRPAVRAVYVVTFSPDGKTVALGGMDVDASGHVELWKLDGTEDSRYSLEGHLESVNDLAYSLDGTILVSASNDKSIKLWDVASRQCVRTLLGHTRSVYSISFTPDGNFLASGGNDHTIKLWCVASGNCIESFKTGSVVLAVEFSPDSRMLLTEGGANIRLHIMDTSMLDELQKELDDLMKMNTEQLQLALTENDITFYSESTNVALVNYLVKDLSRSRRKNIILKWKMDYSV